MAELAGTWTHEPRDQRERPGTFRLSVALIFMSVLTVLFPIYALSEVDGRAGVSMPLQQVPQGVSVHNLDDTRIFLVRELRQVMGFRNTSPHLNVALWWCPNERVFMSPAHGEVFDAEGRLLWGPSPVDMRRIEVDVLRDRVVVRPDQLEPPVQAQPRAESDLPADVRQLVRTRSCTGQIL